MTLVKWAGERWNVTVRQTDTGVLSTEVCDYVIIGNGHYTRPVKPKIQGEEQFKGKFIKNIFWLIINI